MVKVQDEGDINSWREYLHKFKVSYAFLRYNS